MLPSSARLDGMPATTPAMRELRKAAKRFTRAQEARDAALDDLRAAIRAADAAGGHTRNEIIAASGVARQTVFDALRTAETKEDRPDA